MTIGTLAGLFSGLFGVGGGSVIVPLLILWLGYDLRAATGTSLAAIVFIAAFAAAAQAAYGNVRVLDGLLMGVPAVGGVLLGHAAGAAPGRACDLAPVRRSVGRLGSRVAAAMIWAIPIGVAAGLLAGLLGVGGGVLFVPALVIFVGLSQHAAEATSLLAIIPVAIVGTYKQDRYGNVRRTDALLLGVLSIAGASGGVALANALSGTLLRDLFAALMVIVAAQLVRKTLRDGVSPRQSARPGPPA